MSYDVAILAVRTGWSLGTKMGTHFRVKKEARDARERMWQALRLFCFVFAVSILAIGMSDVIRCRMT